jgi:hypothetical protein
MCTRHTHAKQRKIKPFYLLSLADFETKQKRCFHFKGFKSRQRPSRRWPIESPHQWHRPVLSSQRQSARAHTISASLVHTHSAHLQRRGVVHRIAHEVKSMLQTRTSYTNTRCALHTRTNHSLCATRRRRASSKQSIDRTPGPRAACWRSVTRNCSMRTSSTITHHITHPRI